MNFFITATEIHFKRITIPSVMVMALVLLLSMTVGTYIEGNKAVQAAIGICFEAPSEISDRVQETLTEFSTMSIQVYEDANRMKDDTAAGRIESGYLFFEDLQEAVARGDINSGVMRYSSSSTVSAAFTDELIFAALMKTAAPYVAAQYLATQNAGSFGELFLRAETQIESYYQSDAFLKVDIQPVGDAGTNQGEVSESSSGKTKIPLGIYAVFILISFFYLLLQVVEEKSGGVYHRLSSQKKAVYLVAFILANGMTILAVSVIGMFFLHTLGLGRIFAATLLYMLFLVILTLLLGLLIRRSSFLYTLFPVLAIAIILFSGAFFDLGQISPALGRVSRWFPSYHFVERMGE